MLAHLRKKYRFRDDMAVVTITTQLMYCNGNVRQGGNDYVQSVVGVIQLVADSVAQCGFV